MAPMTAKAALLTHGFEQARLALASLIGMGRFNLRPETITRSLKQRVSGTLKELEIIVRRLLTLMALGLNLAPITPRPVTALPETPAKTEAQAPKKPRRIPFRLGPRVLPLLPIGGIPSGIPATGPVDAMPLMHRLAVLQHVLKDPAAHARRLARILERQRKSGGMRPVIAHTARGYRLRAELGTIASFLPGLLNTAFADLYDTS